MNNEKKNFIQNTNRNFIPLIIILTIISLSLILFVSAIPLWTGDGFVPPTPDNATSTENSSFQVNMSFSESSLNTFIWNWGSTNYTIYNPNVKLFVNMNNISSLGETDIKIVDLSLSSFNGTVTEASFTTSGKYGGAFNFDGINDYVTFGNNIVNDTNTFTIIFWIKTNNGVDSFVTQRSFVGNRGSVEGTGTNGAYFDTISGTLRFIVGNASGGIGTASGNNALWDNTWHMVAGVYNGTALMLYQDGVLIKNVSAVGNIATNKNFEIGRDSRSAGFYLNASLDEISVLNISLSASEINQNYRSNLMKYNLTQWYFYTNQSLTNDGANDYSVYASDGTNSNITSRTIYYCYPLPNTDWIIDEGNCVSNNKAIGTRTNNITITNNFNLTLKGTNLTADAITIHSGSRLIKSNSSILTIA